MGDLGVYVFVLGPFLPSLKCTMSFASVKCGNFNVMLCCFS